MVINDILRAILEIGLGIVYLVGAVFNTLYTYRHGDEFYGGFARGTLIPPVRRLIEGVVIPRSRAFTIVLVIFQVSVALALLSRGPYTAYGLWAGALFCLVAAAASSLGGAIANLILAVLQGFLATAG
jgi:hypothetical protein